MFRSIAVVFSLALTADVLLAQPAAEPVTLDAAKFIDPALPDCGIQKAMDSLGPKGGTVLLPEGKLELLRSLMVPANVTLQGRGPVKTTILSRRTNTCAPLVKCEGAIITLAKPCDALKVGTTVFVWERHGVSGYMGYYEGHLVKAIDGATITLDGARFRGGDVVRSKDAFIEFGLCSLLTADCAKGATELQVADASIFTPGQAVSVGTGDSNGNESLSFIKEIKGNTLVLERPIRIEHKISEKALPRRPAVWTLFPLITAENVKGIGVRDLALDCPIKSDERPHLRRYTLSLIHTYNTEDSLIENVTVRNSFTDGVSVQVGRNVTVRNCVVTGCEGNGFHPGTGLTDSLFEKNTAKGNGVGLYFCWSNTRQKILNNVFSENRGGGMTGLGNPNEHYNLLEGNTIERNGGAGIEINGGQVAKNTLRKNVIRDNSAGAPGKHPGIALYASAEDAKAYTIEGNTIESTVEPPTQWIGIEEKAFKRGEKMNVCDENVIRGNKVTGHKTADILLVGPKTVCEDNGEAKVVRSFAKEETAK